MLLDPFHNLSMPKFLSVLTVLLALHSISHAEQKRLRVAHIGLELDGSWSWIREVALNPGAELAAVADPNKDLQDRAKKQAPPGTRIFPHYVQMLDEVKPDAVTVTVPNSRHLEVLRECARRRVHVWFQKPMAATADQAREMEKLARDSGITLMISYHTLWSAPMRAVASKIAAGGLGTIRRIEIRHAFSLSKILSPYYERQFLDPTLHGGGALMDQGTYGIDFAVWQLGRPLRVFATGKTIRPRPGLQSEDDAWVVLDYPGATAVIYGGWWADPDGPGVGLATISGTKGLIHRDLNQVMYTPANGAPVAVTLPVVPPDQRGGIAHFLECIRAGRPVDAPHSAALNVIVNEVVDAAHRSMRTGRAITLQ